ncbi:MAG: 2-C-methyl-D-erythritol 2,4-cyclodiphosphate synthase [Candidatus Omnitrophica bacterium]|nr:2-C-methyl-D-erythritol 2,4-cyclodiphosphate synthase [Candidatus Omnitrophota bacterium]
MENRIGIGYDLHRLAEGRPLYLGGVNIPFSKGLIGHSDADVLCHAICDAILGACNEPDIGEHFPDTDSRFRGISGGELIRMTCRIVRKKRAVDIINLDTVVVCDSPNLSSYKQRMAAEIAGFLEINTDRVSIKAKTSEETRRDCICAYAVILLNVG